MKGRVGSMKGRMGDQNRQDAKTQKAESTI